MAAMTTGRPHSNIGFIRKFAPDWQELRQTYPRITASLALTIAVLLLTDFSLIIKRIEFGREQKLLRASMVQTEIQRADAMKTAQQNLSATGDQLARRKTLLDRELHLAVDREKGVMYLQREAALLREMPVLLSRETGAGTGPGAASPARRRGRDTVARVLGGSYSWEIPASAFLQLGLPVPADRSIPGALGPTAVILEHGAVIYSQPAAGPLKGRDYLLPGGIRAEAADLEAIRADLQPGMKVYFYGHESPGN